MTSKIAAGLMSSFLFAACVADDAALVDETSETAQESVFTNGTSTNGVSLNGVSLNGVSLNGVSLNGVSLNGVSLNGVSLNGVSLNGTTLTGETVASSSLGATLTGMLSNGASLTLRVDSAAPLAAPNTDLWSYGISYESGGTWHPLCGDPAIGALKVMGTWGSDGAHADSSTSFTFACRGASIAKCVEMGYKTTATRDQMLSCVRLLRGDFCGTGVPYTVDGNQVNIYDTLGVQKDTQLSWMFEAEWTPNGARCITLARHTRFADSELPSCLVSGELPTTLGCATGFRNGAVLISEIPVISNR